MSKSDIQILPHPPIENLVFEGGGVKGIVYVGSVEILHKRDLLKDVKRVAGSSAGGITALLLSLGYSFDDIQQEMHTMNFEDFLDKGEKKFWDVLGWWRDVSSIVSDGHGLYAGEKFLEWAKDKIEHKLGKRDITFKEFHELSKNNLELKDITLTGTNLSTGQLSLFNHTMTPDLSLALAVRITMSFPGAFSAVTIDNDVYIDGGVASNFPMFIYDNREMLPSGYDFTDAGANPGTLGFRVDNADEMKEILWTHHSLSKKTTLSTKEFATALLFVRGADLTYEKYSTMTIQIPDMGVQTLQFALMEEQKQSLRESGRRATNEWFSLYRDGSLGAAYKKSSS